MRMITEPTRNVPVARTADVLVAGGGIAGAAAALAAARNGAHTILLEKECALGGLATLGLIVMYLPLCDGYGHQVMGGIAEELLRKSITYGNLAMHEPWQSIPQHWNEAATAEQRSRKRFRVDYDAAPMILMLEQLLIEAGVEIWYDTRLCSAMVEGKQLHTVLVENKSGRLALEAKAFVDATGDADLCAFAGETTVSSNQNRRSGWYFSANDAGHIHLHPLTDPLNAPCPPDSRYYSGDRGSEVSAYVQAMHAHILNHSQKEKGNIPFLLPTLPLFRMTRRLKAQRDLTEAMLGCWQEDAVAMTGDWRKPAPVYTIGLSHLQGTHVGNLFAAGRCIGAEGDAWDVTRVIPTCAATGQAAGTASAQLAASGEIDLPKLQKRLMADGVILDRALAEGMPNL